MQKLGSVTWEGKPTPVYRHVELPTQQEIDALPELLQVRAATETVALFHVGPPGCGLPFMVRPSGFVAGAVDSETMDEIRAAVSRYHESLGGRVNGFIAADRAIREIELLLGMEWEPGRPPEGDDDGA